MIAIEGVATGKGADRIIISSLNPADDLVGFGSAPGNRLVAGEQRGAVM
jgi:hypothetical protein